MLRTGAHRRGPAHDTLDHRVRHQSARIATGTDGDNSVKWSEPYRHWLFKPAEFQIRPQYAKKK